MDYILEATENKALKGSGGVIGLTLRDSALARWFLSRPVTSKYSQVFQNTIRPSQRKKQKEHDHHSTSKAEINRWNKDITKVNNMFECGTFTCPFNIAKLPQGLINFASGSVATADVEDSLVGALDTGKVMAEDFVKDRLIPDDQGKTNKSFYDPMTRAKIKTMTPASAKAAKPKELAKAVPGEVRYMRLMALNARKKVPRERVMAFENAHVPLSLFSDEGVMFECKKSVFMQKLEALLPGDPLTSIPGADAMIIDGNAILHTLKSSVMMGIDLTYADTAETFFKFCLELSRRLCGEDLTQIHVLFDRYFEDSLKKATRDKRSCGLDGGCFVVEQNKSVPDDWKAFLSKDQNKTDLARCYTDYMLQNSSTHLQRDQTLYISGGREETCSMVSANLACDSGFASAAEECYDLHSNQEESDTRIVLHAIHAARKGANPIVVHSPDTDVLVLLLHHRAAIPAREIFFATGQEGRHASLKRLIPVHTLYNLLSRDQLSVMLTMYCLTGCDTVSSLFGKGKAAPFRLMQNYAEDFQALAELGTHSGVSAAEKAASQRFVCKIYGHDGESLNTLRGTLAGREDRQTTGRKLPPTENSFELHLKRAAIQLIVWKNAHVPILEMPNPELYGYERDAANRLQPQVMSQGITAPELQNDVTCSCSDGACSLKLCKCFVNNQSCTAACSCQAYLPEDEFEDNVTWCTNPYTLESAVAGVVLFPNENFD